MVFFKGMVYFFQFLFVFSSISLREFFISSLRASNILLNLFFRSFSSASSILGGSSLAVIESLGALGVHSAMLEVVRACSPRGHLLGPAPMKVPGLGLFP